MSMHHAYAIRRCTFPYDCFKRSRPHIFAAHPAHISSPHTPATYLCRTLRPHIFAACPFQPAPSLSSCLRLLDDSGACRRDRARSVSPLAPSSQCGKLCFFSCQPLGPCLSFGGIPFGGIPFAVRRRQYRGKCRNTRHYWGQQTNKQINQQTHKHTNTQTCPRTRPYECLHTCLHTCVCTCLHTYLHTHV